MFTGLFKKMLIAIRLLLIFTVLTGVIYPLLVTLFAQLLFPYQANGSLIESNGKIIGSKLIGQKFSDPKYFWSRPSATIPYEYNALYSAGSNLGPSNPSFISAVKNRVLLLKQANSDNQSLIPVDLVTASGSGLDPDISPLAAYYQVHRVAKARGFPDAAVSKLIEQAIQNRSLGIFGESHVNVLQLNIALDNLSQSQQVIQTKVHT